MANIEEENASNPSFQVSLVPGEKNGEFIFGVKITDSIISQGIHGSDLVDHKGFDFRISIAGGKVEQVSTPTENVTPLMPDDTSLWTTEDGQEHLKSVVSDHTLEVSDDSTSPYAIFDSDTMTIAGWMTARDELEHGSTLDDIFRQDNRGMFEAVTSNGEKIEILFLSKELKLPIDSAGNIISEAFVSEGQLINERGNQVLVEYELASFKSHYLSMRLTDADGHEYETEFSNMQTPEGGLIDNRFTLSTMQNDVPFDEAPKQTVKGLETTADNTVDIATRVPGITNSR